MNIGPVQRETHQVRLEGADRVEVTVQFGGGNLDIESGSDALLSGEFAYNVPDLKPEIVYNIHGINGVRGELLIRHKEQTIRWDRSIIELHNEWQLRLTEDVPLDLNADVGASTGELKLGGLRLASLNLTAGAADMRVQFDRPNAERLKSLSVRSGAARLDLLDLGNANLDELTFDGGLGTYTFDFRGEWQRSARAHIKAGASRVLLRIPREIGVRVCPGDLRSGDYDGLREQGDCYVNSLYNQSDIQLDISLDLGLGRLTVKQVN
ncbi:MAG: toast rack family protein [Promethearchaeota archaeon]